MLHEHWLARNELQLSNSKHTVVNSTCSPTLRLLTWHKRAFANETVEASGFTQTYTLRTTNRTEKVSTGVQNQPFEPRTTQQTHRCEQPCWLSTPNKTTRSKSRSSRHFSLLLFVVRRLQFERVKSSQFWLESNLFVFLQTVFLLFSASETALQSSLAKMKKRSGVLRNKTDKTQSVKLYKLGFAVFPKNEVGCYHYTWNKYV